MSEKTNNKRETKVKRLAAALILKWCGPETPDPDWRGTWGQIAAELGLSDRTLERDREDPAVYEEAFKLAIGPGRLRLLNIGLTRLANSAEAEPGGPGVAAANSLLDRLGMPAVTQVAGDPDAPLTVRFVVVDKRVGDDGDNGNGNGHGDGASL
jgi:hypothetical protein